MNETVKEWMDKAEADQSTAARELKVKDRPNYDAVCFHSQQGVEKLMKAVLIQAGSVPPKTHDLILLGDLISKVIPTWIWPRDELRFLTRAAVNFRYPGETSDQKEAQIAFDIATHLREKLLEILHGTRG